MLVVETIARIRREYFVKGKPIKEIVRDVKVSRNTVRKVIRSQATAFTYDRRVQPMPKLGPWTAGLERMLETNETKSKRERLTLLRISEALEGLGYGGGYDAVRRYAKAWRWRRSASTAQTYVPLVFSPGEALGSLVEQLRSAQARIKQLEVTLLAWHRSNEASRRLATIPGVGVITATALVATIGDGAQFLSGRQLSAWLGLVPRQHSSGGKDRLGRISKRGDGYIRRLLVHGARTVLRWRRAKPGTGPGWTDRLLARRPTNVVLVAMANKTARVAWALLRYERIYRPTPA